MQPEIIIQPVSRERFSEHADVFGDMVKVVVDVERGILALGGEMHVDEEQLLLEHGSKQADLWGANVYVERPATDRLEYRSMINIRPRQGNRDQLVQDPAVRDAMRRVIDRLIPA